MQILSINQRKGELCSTIKSAGYHWMGGLLISKKIQDAEDYSIAQLYSTMKKKH